MPCDDLEGWDCRVGSERGPRGGRDKYLYMADSLHCTAETNMTL